MRPFGAIGFLLFSLVVHADDSIFGGAGQPLPTVSVTMTSLADSPTMREHADEVRAAAEAKLDKMERDGVITAAEKTQIKGWFKELPFKRIVDVELTFLTGLPDTVGLCLEANPSVYVSIDACAGSVIFLSAISAHVTSRFLHYESITRKVNADGSVSYWGHEFGVGPSVGARRISIFGFDTAGMATGIDTLLSAEYVYWLSRYFGIGVQLDAGATFVVEQEGSGVSKSVLPNVKLSLGLSF